MRGDRQEVRATLIASLLDAILDLSDDAIVCHDPGGRITSWNQAAERLFGYDPTEIVGAGAVRLFPSHVEQDIRRLLGRVGAGERVDHFETEILRKDGMVIPVSLSICPVYDPAGDVLEASVLIARDITEQRLAQATLAEIETRVRESETLASVGSWLWDVGTGTVQWSDEFHRIHGIDPLEFEGTLESHLRSIHSQDRERVWAEMEKAVASGRPFDEEYRVVRPDGQVRLLHAGAQPTVDSAGLVVGLRGIGQDVTDRRGR